MEREELAAWLRLALTEGVGNTAARRLLAAVGLPQDILAAASDALEQVVSPAQARALLDIPPGFDEQLQLTWDWLAQGGGRRILTLADSGYPQGLLETADPPLMLYLMGNPHCDWPAAIAMVGSRNPTPQGLANARQFARSFVQAGLTVVSGMATGVDGAAHEGALEGAAPGQLATIAVVGTGLDRVYPRKHLDLAHRIAQQGWIASEYPLGTPPLAENFPRRNRIIAALSQGTLVVEAALQSGSLITARQASEQGKDVFAIPGSIHSAQARGCHWLLKQGAKLVETAQDVLEELRPGLAANAPVQAAIDFPAPATDRDASLLAALGFDPVSLDALVARTGMAAPELQARLLELELDGRVSRLPGGLFQQCGAA